MAVSRERFDQGMTYDQYKAQMTRNQDRFIANEQEVQIDPEDLATFQRLPKPLNVLVLAEDWCGDVVSNLPILGRLAAASGKLNIRVFLRDQNLDIMDQYLKEGQYRSIPVFVFFDEAFNERGVFIERPDSVSARIEEQRQKLYAAHPEFGSPETPISQAPEAIRGQLMQAYSDMRATSKAADNHDVIHALRALAEQAQ
jgi:hypothetical protein